MKFKKYLQEKKVPFIGTCDRVRRKPKGEDFWQCMMGSRKKTSEREFLRNVDLRDMLDADETWKEWKESQADIIKYYKAEDNVYFLQTAGFEFIFKLK